MKGGGLVRPQTILPVLFVLVLAGCSRFSIYGQFRSLSTTTSTPATGVEISPSVSGVLVGGSESFTASGGTPPYTFSVLGGGAGGSIVSTTGAYTGATTAGNDTVQVMDQNGQIANAIVTVVGVAPLTISPTLLTLEAGTAMTYTFQASGGVPPYKYSLVSGSVGSINQTTGVYSAPSSTTTSSIAGIAVTDSLNMTATTANNAITFASNSSTSLTVSPATTGAVTEGNPITVVSFGGTPNYTVSATPGSGWTTTPASAISGPFAFNASVSGSYTVKVTDSSGPPTLKASATISVLPLAPSNLTATVATGGTASLTWANNSASATGLSVQSAVGNGSFSTLASYSTATGPLPTSYQDTGLIAGTVYVYRIVATTGSVQSYSNYVVVVAK